MDKKCVGYHENEEGVWVIFEDVWEREEISWSALTEFILQVSHKLEYTAYVILFFLICDVYSILALQI